MHLLRDRRARRPKHVEHHVPELAVSASSTAPTSMSRPARHQHRDQREEGGGRDAAQDLDARTAATLRRRWSARSRRRAGRRSAPRAARPARHAQRSSAPGRAGIPQRVGDSGRSANSAIAPGAPATGRARSPRRRPALTAHSACRDDGRAAPGPPASSAALRRRQDHQRVRPAHAGGCAPARGRCAACAAGRRSPRGGSARPRSRAGPSTSRCRPAWWRSSVGQGQQRMVRCGRRDGLAR